MRGARRLTYADSRMKNLLITLLHFAVVTAKLCGPGGVRAVIAENLVLKQQLIVLRRGRQRAPNLALSDRLICGLASLFLSPGRIRKVAIGLRPSTFLAFRVGAKSINPKFEVKEIYTGNFDDAGAAKLATLSLINAGCDFIFHQANEAGRGVFQACSERKVRCFGSNKNQNDLAPDVILASAVLDMPPAFVYMARRSARERSRFRAESSNR